MNNNHPFSVLMSVYKNDKPEDFRIALESVTTKQTLQPSEVVLVVDGPVPDAINSIISESENASPDLYKVVRLEQNQGLGIALKKGLEAASNEIVMRMDSDDIAVSDRFEKQYQFMVEHPEVAVCGGQIDEFIDDVKNIVGRRIVPCTNEDIYKYMISRCAFNHMTVALRRSVIIANGNYLPWHYNEDYYLWIRLMIAKVGFANMPDTLLHMRVGREMYKRRGGRKYYESELGLQKLMLSNELITYPHYWINIAIRWIVQVAMPNWLRGWFFRTFARK